MTSHLFSEKTFNHKIILMSTMATRSTKKQRKIRKNKKNDDELCKGDIFCNF